MQEKHKASQLLQDFYVMIYTQFRAKVKMIRSDNGSEFISGPMKKFYREQGIIHQKSCIDTPQQNGRVERKHRHILNVVRALRFQANLPLNFWGECVLMVASLINRTSSSILDRKTPYEVLFNTKLSYDHIKVFGCLSYVYNPQKPKDKFGARSQRCLFVGYPHGTVSYTHLTLPTKRIV